MQRYTLFSDFSLHRQDFAGPQGKLAHRAPTRRTFIGQFLLTRCFTMIRRKYRRTYSEIPRSTAVNGIAPIDVPFICLKTESLR